jgi:hypothetical protein
VNEIRISLSREQAVMITLWSIDETRHFTWTQEALSRLTGEFHAGEPTPATSVELKSMSHNYLAPLYQYIYDRLFKANSDKT